MHPIKFWEDCQDATCKCNEYLARQRPIPAKKDVRYHGIERSHKGLSDREHGKADTYNKGCRCVGCKEANAARQKKNYDPAKRHRAYQARKLRLA